MEFARFCNICLNTDNDVEEHENASNILIALIGNVKFIKKSKVYLCRSCCVKLEEYENFRNICTTNILEFRYLYFELKRKLEANDDPEMENKLRKFINAKVCNKGDNSVYEEIEPTCVAFKDNVCSTITPDSDIKYDNEIIDIKSEKNEIHSENDLENEIATQLDPLQNNTYDIKMEAGVDAVNSNKENADVEKSSQTEIEENDKLPTGTSTTKFTRHDNVCIGANSHTCNVCDKTFTDSSSLIRHQRIHDGDKSYTCNVCDKAFSRSSNLIQHQRIHSGDKPYTCSVCDKSFSRSSHLIVHQRIHSGHKPYICNVCDKAFTASSSLLVHQRIHTGDKPYTCNVCHKAFTQSSHLKDHQRIHNRDKSCTWNVCDKTFTVSSNLIVHQRIHSGDKPYTCSVCDNAFTQSPSLIRHQGIHNVEKP